MQEIQDKIENIDQRLTALENMHKYAIITILAIGSLYFLSKQANKNKSHNIIPICGFLSFTRIAESDYFTL